MKIILIHGDHSLKSYERLQTLINVAKERDWEIVKIDPENKMSLPEKVHNCQFVWKRAAICIREVT